MPERSSSGMGSAIATLALDLIWRPAPQRRKPYVSAPIDAESRREGMLYIADDLVQSREDEPDKFAAAWAEEGLDQLEAYLAKHAAFDLFLDTHEV